MEKTIKAVINILFGVILIGGLFWGLSFYVKSERDTKVHLYRVQFDNTVIWTKEVVFRENGGAEFIDVKTNKKFIVYGSYAIIEPKTK